MFAIITKWHPCSAVKGARYSASNSDFKVFVSDRDDLSTDENHREAVRKLCAKLGWTGTLVEGDLPGGSKVFVWRQERLRVAEELVITDHDLALVRQTGSRL